MLVFEFGIIVAATKEGAESEKENTIFGMAFIMTCSGLSGMTVSVQKVQAQTVEERKELQVEVERTRESYGNFEYRYDDFWDALEITGYYGDEEKIVVPAEINGKKVRSVAQRAFVSCDSIKHIILSEGISKIGQYAFISCSNLKSISLPASLQKIETGGGSLAVYISEIFKDCSSLTDIEVAEENEVYASENGALYDKEKTELIFCPAGKTSVVIPASVTKIRGDSSYNSNRYSFCYNGSLKEITVAEDNLQYASEDGVLYNKEKTELIFCPPGKNSVVVPASVTNISQINFWGRNHFNVTIADGNTVYAYENGILYNKERKRVKQVFC